MQRPVNAGKCTSKEEAFGWRLCHKRREEVEVEDGNKVLDQEAVFLPKKVRVRDLSRAFLSSFVDTLGERPCRSEEFFFFLSSASAAYLGL